MVVGFGVETPGSSFFVPGCHMCQGCGADEAEGDREGETGVKEMRSVLGKPAQGGQKQALIRRYL